MGGPVMSIECRSQGAVAVVTIDRPEVANAIDRPTAAALADTFRRFEADGSLHAAVLTGANGTFCAGADLKAMREPGMERASRLERDGDGPVGPTRMLLVKPVIAAVDAAIALATEIASRPQVALRSDRLSSYEQWSRSLSEALTNEYDHGMRTLATGEMLRGLDRYGSGRWRGGDFT